MSANDAYFNPFAAAQGPAAGPSSGSRRVPGELQSQLLNNLQERSSPRIPSRHSRCPSPLSEITHPTESSSTLSSTGEPRVPLLERLSLRAPALSSSSSLGSMSSIDKVLLLSDFLDQSKKEQSSSAPGGVEDAIFRSLRALADGGDDLPGGEPHEGSDSEAEPSRKRRRDFESEDGDRQGKGRKIREEDFPWFEAAQRFADEKLTPSMRETRRIIDAARGDVATVVHWAQLAPGAPTNFPDSEWTNLLQGRAIDLNSVHANFHILQPLREDVARLGSISIVISSVDRSKTLKTADDWYFAWRKSLQATVLVFPHRRDELEKYTECIQRLFHATIPPAHERIFLLDQAIRGRVGGGQSSSLVDEFNSGTLQLAFMHPGGVEFRNSRPKNKGRPNVCNRYNSKAGCKGAPNCHYQHVCRWCGYSGHGRTTCTRRGQAVSPNA